MANTIAIVSSRDGKLFHAGDRKFTTNAFLAKAYDDVLEANAYANWLNANLIVAGSGFEARIV